MKLPNYVQLWKRSKIFQSKNSGRGDGSLFLSILLLSVVGVITVYNASVAVALKTHGNQWFFALEQLRYLFFGFIVFFLTQHVDYKLYSKFALPFMFGTLFLLILVFLPGVGVRAYGASRWLNLGLLTVQPSEIAKFTVVVYLATWLARPERGRLGAFLLLLSIIMGLIILQPNLSTALIVLGIGFSMYYVSGAPLRQFMILVPVLLIGVVFLAIASPYRLQRVLTFIDPNRDPQGASYQIRQGLLAFGLGGVTGVGLGNSKQKYEYLPEVQTDSIIAIVAEETGFLGFCLFNFLYAFIIWRGFTIASLAPNMQAKLIVIGITMWFSIQTIMNLSANVALIPLTGVPLPLVSVGGSSLIILLAAFGVVINISKHSTIKK